MKKIYILLLLCSWITESAAEMTLEQRVTQLEREVSALKQHIEQLNNTQHKPVANVTDDLQLRVTKWYFRTEKVKFNTYYALDIELTNHFEKGIKEIDARVRFSDLLGGLLYTVTLGKQLQLAAGQMLVDKGTQINQRLIAEQHPLKRMNERDVKAELMVRRIVFEDDTVWDAPSQ
jgi:uncharacterized coiled-coil protein SlyX